MPSTVVMRATPAGRPGVGFVTGVTAATGVPRDGFAAAAAGAAMAFDRWAGVAAPAIPTKAAKMRQEMGRGRVMSRDMTAGLGRGATWIFDAGPRTGRFRSRPKR